MHLRYMFTDKRKTLAHLFHVKFTWQLLPIQKSVASEYYREQTKLARTCFNSFPRSFRYIVISQRMREKLSAHLNVIAKSILKKLMKEQLQSLWTPHNRKKAHNNLMIFYKPLTNPILLNTAQKVNRIVNKLFLLGNIDTMTQVVNNQP